MPPWGGSISRYCICKTRSASKGLSVSKTETQLLHFESDSVSLENICSLLSESGNMHEADHCTSIINLTYQDGREGSPSNPAKFNKQDYVQLKDTCLRRRRLFVDSTFPPNNRSLGDLPDLSSWRQNQVEWLRPAVECVFFFMQLFTVNILYLICFNY